MSYENDVTVLTPKKTLLHGPLNYEVKNQKYKLFEYEGVIYWLIKKFNLSNKLFIKCHYIMWCFHVVIKAIREHEKYDVVISTYNTWHCHFLGYMLKKLKFTDKWIADYRDLWNNNSHREYKYFLIKQISTFFEKLFLKKADAITTVSEPLVHELRSYLNYNKVVFRCIYNGFDNQEPIKAKKYHNKIILSHTGSIYQNHRDPSLLFHAVSNLINSKSIERSNIKIRFIGDIIGNVNELAVKFQLQDIVELTGQVNRKKSIKIQRDSDFLVLLNSGEKASKGVITGKIFEYISSGVPILGIGFTRDNIAGKLIFDTNTGRTFIDSKKIEECLFDYFKYKKIPWFKPKHEIINNFRIHNQVEKLLELIIELKGGN